MKYAISPEGQYRNRPELVYAARSSGEKKTMGDEDIRPRVASWAEAVQFRILFLRGLLKKQRSLLRNKCGYTEDYSENDQGDRKNAEAFLQEERFA